MKLRDITQKTKSFLSSTPKKVWFISVGVLLVTVYGLVFFIPKSMTFAYTAPQACTDHFAVAPDLLRQSGNDDYQMSLEGGWSLFGARITSAQLCITPTNQPEEGTTNLRVAPFGGPIASKSITVNVPAAPVVSVENLSGKSISASKKLNIPLTAKDVINDYQLSTESKTADCTAADTHLECDVPALDLQQGSEYTLAIQRRFQQTKPVIIDDVPVKTLTAIQVTDATVKNDQIIYDKPTTLTVAFDKPVQTAVVELMREEGENKTPIKVELQPSQQNLDIQLEEQLPRNAQFILTLKSVESDDGSTLANPVVTRFTTSGGPKVSSVSVGANGVAQNQRIVVTFDQAMKADAQIATFARIEGAPAAIAKVADNQLAFTLQNAPLCAGFSLVVEKGLPSGSNDEVSTEPWKFDSRTVCGYSQSIGTSLQGRPIVAHYFGNGSKTILFNGAIHGTEVSSYTTMQAWVAHLQTNAHKIPADKRIVVIPNVNPDGVANGTRNNSRNVNLARNFPSANWSASIDTASGVLPQGGGTAPLSEPEAQALANITRQLRPRLLVSFHSQGRLVGANQVGDSTTIGSQYASTVGYGTMFGTAEDVMGYSITGEYETWVGESLGIPAILIELPSHSGNYLNSQMNALNKVLAL